MVETFSVIFQVGYFKMTGGKRIFRMAPLHHHFELKGMGGAESNRAILDNFYFTGFNGHKHIEVTLEEYGSYR